MDVFLHGAQRLDVFRPFGPEGVQHPLALAQRMHPALDAEPRNRSVEAKASEDDADGAQDGRRMHEDFRSGAGEPVAARRADIVHEAQHRHALLLAEPADAVGDPGGLDGAAAGTVDGQRDRLQPPVAEGALDTRRHGLIGERPAAAPARHANDARERQDGDGRSAAELHLSPN